MYQYRLIFLFMNRFPIILLTIALASCNHQTAPITTTTETQLLSTTSHNVSSYDLAPTRSSSDSNTELELQSESLSNSPDSYSRYQGNQYNPYSNHAQAKTLKIEQIVNRYPHDPYAFTEGLQYEDGLLYESTGLNGRSSVRKVNIDTGRPVQNRKMTLPNAFGEGLTVLNGRVYQITYKEGKAFVYDKNLNSLQTFSYSGEGWGLTNDNTSLIMSNGSSTLYWRNPHNFAIEKQLRVTDNGKEVSGLNELEYVNGQIYANIFPTPRIARIDAQTGQVTGWLDVSGLRRESNNANNIRAVSNGIAYNADKGTFFLTGKYWSTVFEVKLSDFSAPINTPTPIIPTPVTPPVPQPVPVTPPPAPKPIPAPSHNSYTDTSYIPGLSHKVLPSMDGFAYSGGRLSGQINGPQGTNFNLYLYQRPANSRQWKMVAKSVQPGSQDRIDYQAPRGNYIYRWQVHTSERQGGEISFQEQRQ